MPNVLLTRSCVRSCPYCFAGQHTLRADEAGDGLMTWENFIYIVDFFSRGGDKSISLLGGEPLLHPEAPVFIAYAVARGLHVSVFTSAIATDGCLDSLVRLTDSISPGWLTFIVNYNHPEHTRPDHQAAIERFLDRLGPYVILGVNIFKTPYTFDHIPQLVNRFRLQRHLRVGVAHPIPGGHNRSVKPSQMSQVATDIVDSLPLLEASGITVGLDCGFPLCAFTDSQLGRLYLNTGDSESMRFICCRSTDIDPDMQVWNCFPVSKYESRPLFDFSSVDELDRWLEEFHQSVRVEHGGLYPECDNCRHRDRGLCSGGCLGHPLSLMFNEDPSLRNERISNH